MIRSEAEYQEALRRLKQDQDVAVQQREALVKSNLSAEEVGRGDAAVTLFPCAVG
ncbi:MAG: hypothetical protein Q8R28_13585 [Dehalococcoidia bacterium]|nr:hypothetical protein [Dehalococcoidia bacterium]